MLNSRLREKIQVGQKPIEASPGVFLWIPAFADVRFTPFPFEEPDNARRLSVPLCIKTLGRSDSALIEGAPYASLLSDFRPTWPGIL